MMEGIRRWVNNVLIFVIFYLFIFQPPIISRELFLILELLFVVLYNIYYKTRPIFEFVVNFKFEFLFLSLIVVYAIFRDALVGDIVYCDRAIYFVFQTFFLNSLICDWAIRNKKNLCNIFFNVAFGASIITFLTMVNRDVYNYIEQFMKEEFGLYENFEVRYRGYGFSENITFTFSYILGIAAGLSLLKVGEKLLYLVSFSTCLIAVAFNARIGFLPIIFFTIYSFSRKGSVKNILILLVGILIFFECIYFCFPEQVELYYNASSDWILSFFREFLTLNSTTEGTIKTLFSDFIIFPETLSGWIFGTGESLYLKSVGNSDVGFILQLNYGGMINLLLYFLFIIFTTFRIYKNLSNTEYRWFPMLYLFSIFVLNTKGFFFAGTPGARTIYMLYFFFLCINSPKYIQNKYI